MCSTISFFALVGVTAAVAYHGDPTIDIMVQRLRQQNIYPPSQVPYWDSQVDYALSVLQANGSFSDINYFYQAPAIWPAYNHTMRAQYMSRVFISPGSKYYQDTSFLPTALHVLDYWLSYGTDSKQNNWWWWTIGVGYSLGITVNILSDAMLPNQTAAAATQLLLSNPKGQSGANLVWTCEGTLYRGMLTQNMTAIQEALNLSYATLQILPKADEGIAADYVYNFHGAQIYNGGYGMSYAQGISIFFSLTRDTPLGLNDTDPRVELFTNFMLEGSLQMIRYGTPPQGSVYAHGLFDVSTVGRDLTRPYNSNWGNQAGVQLEFSADQIANIGGTRGQEFQVFGSILNGTASSESILNATVGNRVFSSSDYTLHTSGLGTYNGLGWMTTVRMASTRTLRCECINGENKFGLHLSDMVAYTYTDGYEYVDSMPVWDWMRLPGITVLPYAVPWTCGGGGTSAFVGGVTDGTFGSATMDYVAANNEGLTAKKSLFFFDDLFVGLGANITAQSPLRDSFPSWTGVAQHVINMSAPDAGAVYYFTTGFSAPTILPAGSNISLPTGTWWVWQGGRGYVFPDAYGTNPVTNPTVHVSNMYVNGTWETIGAMSGEVTLPMFSLWFTHAAPVANAAYAYIVVPNIDYRTFQTTTAAAIVAPAAQGGLAIVRNDGHVQAVLHGGVQSMQASVFILDSVTNPSTTNPTIINGGPGWNVTVSHIGSFLIRDASPPSYQVRGGRRGNDRRSISVETRQQGMLEGGKGGETSTTTTTTTTPLSFVVSDPSQAGNWTVEIGIDRSIQAGGSGGTGGGSCVSSTVPAPGQSTWGVVFSSPSTNGTSSSVICAAASS